METLSTASIHANTHSPSPTGRSARGKVKSKARPGSHVTLLLHWVEREIPVLRLCTVYTFTTLTCTEGQLIPACGPSEC